MKRPENLNLTRTAIEKHIAQTFKRNKWEQFKDFVGIFFIALFLLICIAVVLTLGIYLIENPVSLAIISGTIILLFLIWRLN